MKTFYLSLIACILSFKILAADAQPPISHSWVDLPRYSGDESCETLTRTDLKQLMFEFQNDRVAVAQLSKDTESQSKEKATGAYTRLSTPCNNNFGIVNFTLLHWERNIPAQREDLQTQSADNKQAVEVFVAAPTKRLTYRGANLNFIISGDDFFEQVNTTESAIVDLRINSADGSGWQTMKIGGEIPVSYDSTGEKAIVIQATLADGSIVTARSTIDVQALTTPDYDICISVGGEYNNKYYGAKLYYLRAPAPIAFENPVLVVEGFDLENNMDWDALYNLVNKQRLAETLQDFGRDLFVLDFDDATADIFGNSAAAMDAIRVINLLRNNASGKFTVIGASMGGLVSRLALINFEQNPSLYGHHQVDTWISFDSPHQGANIPLGLQEFLYFFEDRNSAFAAAKELYKILGRPAAKQMLLAHVNHHNSLAGNPEHVAFQTQLNSTGYPGNCKTIAISNGAGKGLTQPFSPGEKIIHWRYRSTEIDIDADIYAINTSQTKTPLIFSALWDPWGLLNQVTTSEKRYYNYALDDSSGGQRNSFQQLFDSIPSGYRGNNDYCLAPNHCFVPTTSSIGIQLDYIRLPLQDNPTLLAQSPFDEIHFASSNEDHIDINYRNKNWFMRGVLEDCDSDGDGFDDYVEYCNETDYLDPESKLSVHLNGIRNLADGRKEIVWSKTPNAQYKVYWCEKLGQEWQEIPDLYYHSPSYSSEYFCTLSSTNNSSFYKVVAKPSDPAY